MLAALPALFALQTWQLDYRFDLVRHFSLPVVAGEVIVVALAVAGGHRPWSAFARVRSADLLLVAAWLSCALAVSIYVAREPKIALLHFAITSIHVLFGFAIWERLTTGWARFARPLLIASAAGAFGYALLVYGLALSVRNDPAFDFRHFGPGVSHVRQLGFYGLVLACLSVGLLTTAERHRRPMFFAMLTIGFALIDWSGGRAAFVAGLLAAAVCVLLLPAAGRRPMLGWIAAAWLLAIPLSLIFVPHPGWGFLRILGAVMPDASLNAFFSNRLEVWTETLRRILDRPLLGHGEGQFRLSIDSAGGFYNHPHNWLLQFLYQWGLVGTGLLLALVARRFASARAAVVERPKVAIPVLTLIVGLLAMACLEGTFFHPYPVMNLVLALAALAAGARSAD